MEPARKINRYTYTDKEWPSIGDKKVLLVIGQHAPFSEKESHAIETFAKKHDVAIYVNHISNYNGYKTVHGNISFVGGSNIIAPDIVITIGVHLGDYSIDGYLRK